LFKEDFFLFFEDGDFLVILFFHFRDEFVLHVDLFFGHLLKVGFLFLNVFLDFEQLIRSLLLNFLQELLLGQQLLIMLQELFFQLLRLLLLQNLH
jgi:hypothetical protein